MNISPEFARHILRASKPKKPEAQWLIVELADKANTMEQREMLAKLYQYFRPAMTAKAKLKAASENPLAWLALAVDPKEQRNLLRYIYVDDDSIVTLDGVRAHITRNVKNLTNGYYEPADFIRTDVDLSYPQWRKLLVDARSPDYARCELVDLDVTQVPYNDQMELVQVTFPDGHHAHYNALYWEQLTVPFDASASIMYDKAENKRGRLQVKQGDNTGMIMPFKR